MSIRDDMNANIDWPWFLASWADHLFNPEYPGGKPAGTEKADTYVQGFYSYSHVAAKYLNDDKSMSTQQRGSLMSLLQDLTNISRRYAVEWGIPKEFWPTVEDSTLRVLEYRPGAVIAPHYDFNLFTVNLWRSAPEAYRYKSRWQDSNNGDIYIPEIHHGEIWQLIDKHREPTLHWTAESLKTQYSVVFFAMPPLAAQLPDGRSVSEWLNDRKERSRI